MVFRDVDVDTDGVGGNDAGDVAAARYPLANLGEGLYDVTGEGGADRELGDLGREPVAFGAGPGEFVLVVTQVLCGHRVGRQ